MMSASGRIFRVLALLSVCLVATACKRTTQPPTGTYQVNTVEFVLSNPVPGGAGPAPNIWIDTNTEISGLSGGTVKSSKPYGLGIDYTDNSFTLKTLEIQSVRVIYEDGTEDPSAAALKLPIRFKSRKYDTVKSGSGGVIVRSTVRILSGKIAGVITRDEPLTLKITGVFTKDDGTKTPFAIEHRYDIETVNTEMSAGEVLQDK